MFMCVGVYVCICMYIVCTVCVCVCIVCVVCVCLCVLNKVTIRQAVKESVWVSVQPLSFADCVTLGKLLTS